jgi:protein TonB
VPQVSNQADKLENQISQTEVKMFDAIGVSERTQKPWTVVVSFIGQMAIVGLAILAPLVGTDALPHRFSWIALPEPPRALPHRPAAAAAKQTSMIPSQMTPKGLVLPVRIPDRPMMLQDPDLLPAASDGVGVPGGFGNSTGSGNGVIDGLLASSAAPPPPPPPVVRQAVLPAPPKRIRLGGMVEHGKLISGPPPTYPPLAKQARIEGTVRLEAVISREGTILNLRAVSGHPLLIPAALAAVERWIFRPTSLNGDPVEVATEIEVHFTLQR